MPITPGPQTADLTGLEAQVESLQATADQAVQDAAAADARAANAQDMVKRRDPRLDSIEAETVTLKQVADTVTSLSEESTADRHGLHTDVATLTSRLDQLERDPGPPGAPGLPGAPGSPGAPGASAYDLARQLGYGGTMTQWLVSLHGADGAPGAPGAPADMTRVAALEGAAPAFGYQGTTALALLATKDYVVTLNRAMPTTAYNAKPVVDPAFAGKLGVAVTAQTKTTVTVRTTGLVAIGVAGFTILAWP